MRLQATAAGFGPAAAHAPARRGWLKRLGALLGGGLLASRSAAASPLQTQGTDAYIGEIMLFAGPYAPQNYALCNGQLLPINQQYSALYAVIGNYYGGNGTSNFALPNLQGRVPVGAGQGAGLSNYALGQTGGLESVTLITQQLPTHSHALLGSSSPGTSADPTNNLLANDGRGGPQYASSNSNATLNGQSIGAAGGNQPHENRPPFLALNYCICISGIFPSRQ